MKKPKCKHNPKKLPYRQWFEWAEAKSRKGERQKRCPVCGLLFFKEEWKAKKIIMRLYE